MATIARKSDGRRIFSDQFKREQIDRVLRGDLTLSELSRKLGIAPSLLHRWKRLMPSAAGSRGARSPASSLRADQYIRELQLLLGKQTVEIELLRAELAAIKAQRTLMKRPSR
jgi:transposase-like protein